MTRTIDATPIKMADVKYEIAKPLSAVSSLNFDEIPPSRKLPEKVLGNRSARGKASAVLAALDHRKIEQGF